MATFLTLAVVVEINALFRQASRWRRWLLPLALLPMIYAEHAQYLVHTRMATSVDPAPMLHDDERLLMSPGR